MSPNYERLAQAVLQCAESVGTDNAPVTHALVDLESSLAESSELTGLTAVQQVSQKANEILKVLLPEFSEVFSLGGDTPSKPRRQTIKLTEEMAKQILLRELLRGVKMLDGNSNRKAGAVKLMDAIPNPIPRSARPFEDSEPWSDHTHTSSNDLR